MLTIRYEKKGILIYSDKMKNYYFSEDVEVIDKCKKTFNQLKNNETIDTEDTLNQELIKMGCLDGIRELTANTDYLSAPLEYYFDFTSICNLKCTHCYNKEHICSDTICNEKIEEIIKDMYDNGIMRVHLAGGEPTCVPSGLNAYMSTAKKYGIVSSMSSNGVNISNEVIDIMFNNNLFSITISLEGADEKTNAKIRGEGNFEKTLTSVRRLVKRKKELNSDTIICLKMSYDTNTKKEDLENMIILGLKLGVDTIKFANPERCVFHEKSFYSSVYENYYKVNSYVMELKEKYKDKKIFISNIANPVNGCGDIGLPNMKGCIGGQELLSINPDGRISPCLMNQIPLGNIYDYKSISDFWNNSEKLKEYRKIITNYECGDCSYHSQCRGGCQVRKFVEYGKIEGIDPLCPAKKDVETIKEKEAGKTNKLVKINVLHSL